MCGIFGLTSLFSGVANIIFDSLKKLEYRGYDSVGVATVSGGTVYLKKDQGKIVEVAEKINLESLPGRCGIGHTRWATHGAPSKENAHPVTDCNGLVVVVHNGVIENYLELRKKLESAGHKIRSRTDSEVIAHLIEEHMKLGLPFEEAARRALLMLKGSYAFAAISPLYEDTIICARMESPLIVGISSNYACCSSDIPALPRDVERIVPINDGEIAVLKPGFIKLISLSSGSALTPRFTPVDVFYQAAEKGKHPHYMIKEIFEEPQVALNVVKAPREYIDNLSRLIASSNRVFLVGCGTSYHACMYGSHLLRLLARVEAYSAIASEFQESHAELLSDGDAVLAISQSGETADVLHILRSLQSSRIKLLALTNVMGSSITRLVSSYVGLYAGPEIGVAATKTYIAQLVMLSRIAARTSMLRGVNLDLAREVESSLKAVPQMIQQTLETNDLVARSLSVRLSLKHNAFFLARGINVPTALEGALKLKEISYIHAEGYPAGESKHGPIALIEEEYPCVFTCPRDQTYERIIGNIMEMKARGALIITSIEEGDKEVKEISDAYFTIPEISSKLLTPILHVVPLQLLAYYTAVMKGLDPDKPRNLAKSVTVL